jgi:hypothetical protein
LLALGSVLVGDGKRRSSASGYSMGKTRAVGEVFNDLSGISDLGVT